MGLGCAITVHAVASWTGNTEIQQHTATGQLNCCNIDWRTQGATRKQSPRARSPVAGVSLLPPWGPHCGRCQG